MANTELNTNATCDVVTPNRLITEDMVRAALTAHKGTKMQLTEWKVVNFTKKGDNYSCLVSSVEVKYGLEGQSYEEVYVVKVNSLRTCGSSAVLTPVFFEKECKAYSVLIPELNSVLKNTGEREINFPRCIYTNLEKGKEIIFLEDLRTRGYKMFDRTRGMDVAHATLVLKELARLHAASLLLQNNYSGKDLGEIHPSLKKDLHDYMLTSEAVLDIFRKNAIFSKAILEKVGGYARAVAWLDTIIPNLTDIFYDQVENGKPKVVCHGDCWNNNLLFSYDDAGHPKDVMLIDLQESRYSSPATDLNFFIYTSFTGDVLKNNLQNFLDCYHDSFTDIMRAAGQEAPFTRKQLLKDFRDKNPFGAIFGMTILPTVLCESKNAVASSETTGATVDEMMTHARATVMDMLDTNPMVKQRFLALFDDMMEAGSIP